MPEHYKQHKPGSKKYKKAYGEHIMKKLKKKRKYIKAKDGDNNTDAIASE
jgi:hypothetical protein